MAKNRDNGDVGRGFPIVCVGLSLGGIAPLQQLFRNISPTTGMAFVIVHHVRKIPTLLPEILSRCTAMPVKVAATGLAIRPNRVYILPSGKEILAADNHFSVRPRSKLKGWTNVFTVFLESLTKSHHAGIAVVLSGLDEDGSVALRTFKQIGGITIAQAPESAEHAEMPQAAIETGHIDYILGPEQIAPQLEKSARSLKASSQSSKRPHLH